MYSSRSALRYTYAAKHTLRTDKQVQLEVLQWICTQRSGADEVI
jgi:hypothetical protein